MEASRNCPGDSVDFSARGRGPLSPEGGFPWSLCGARSAAEGQALTEDPVDLPSHSTSLLAPQAGTKRLKRDIGVQMEDRESSQMFR